MPRIVSLLPAATEIAAALGLMDDVVGVSHECDFPEEAKTRPRVTRCPVHDADLTSREVDQWVRRALQENGTIYTIDETLLRKLRPNIILTQKLCDVCAVGYGTVARFAETLPGPPQVVNLEPSTLSDIFDDIRRVGEVCGVSDRADKLVAELSMRVEAVHERTAQIPDRPRCFLMEWVDPPFCSGHWSPELVEIAGGHDPLGRKHRPSVEIKWKAVLEARPEIIVLALCGYDVAEPGHAGQLLGKQSYAYRIDTTTNSSVTQPVDSTGCPLEAKPVDRARRDYELLKTFPGFDSLPAAQNNRIYIVDASAYFARPGPRIVDSLEILAGIIHPEQFPEFASGKEERRRKKVERRG